MLRRLWALVAVAALTAMAAPLQIVTPAQAAVYPDSLDFGEPGLAVWDNYPAPMGVGCGNNAGEPTIGIPWETDRVLFQAFMDTCRATFTIVPGYPAPPATVLWEDVSSGLNLVNVDPMLNTDSELGRTWAGGLAGACSNYAWTDDDGDTWAPVGNACTDGAAFDHQSGGSGPWAGGAPPGVWPHIVYYCAQLGYMACSTSVDGGITYAPGKNIDPLGICGGLHGHPRVSDVTGTAVVPNKSCASDVGFARSRDNGATWDIVTVPGSVGDSANFDPSIGISRDNGWLYVGQAGQQGAWIGMSKDEGDTWEDIGQGSGAPPGTKWFDVGALVGVETAVFADVQAGDDRRAAFSFFGSTSSAYPYSCGAASDSHVWHYYVAMTYDGGQTWYVSQATDHPVQIGGVWPFGGGDPCRNLLDFMDMDIDSTGRVHLALADGCLAPGCSATSPPSMSRDQYTTIVRQRTGCGLFAAFDKDAANPDCVKLPYVEPKAIYSGPLGSLEDLVEVCYGDTVPFVDLSTKDPAADWETVTWEFSDTSLSPDYSGSWVPDHTHTFAMVGIVTGTLTVEDSLDQTNETTRTFDVKDCSPPPPPPDPNANLPPFVGTDPTVFVDAGDVVVVPFTAFDPENGALTYTVTGLPTGAVWDPATKTVTWTPGALNAGTLCGLTVVAHDAKGATSLPAKVCFEIRGPVADNDIDGVQDYADNCPSVSNQGQPDYDGDGVGDPCDPTSGIPGPDYDAGGLAGGLELPDTDRDSVDDFADNCDLDPNPGQDDLDGDGMGDACDADMDADGVPQAAISPGAILDNCPRTPNPEQADSDLDGIGNRCDATTGNQLNDGLAGSECAGLRCPNQVARRTGRDEANILGGGGIGGGGLALLAMLAAFAAAGVGVTAWALRRWE